MDQVSKSPHRPSSLFVQSSASFDPTETYRYTLWRRWAPELPDVAWIMLNPSTADAYVLDPTIKRCVSFSKAWGFGGLVVVNLFALRSTDPKALYKHADPVGPGNDAAIVEALSYVSLVMAAWGVHGKYSRRGADVMKLIENIEVRLDVKYPRPPLECLGVSKDGFPRHPLYLPSTTERQRYEVS